MSTYFITGIGTGVGKTVVSAIVTEALHAQYWKPIQAGFDEGTDCDWVRTMISNNQTTFNPEVYKLRKAASPHIAAREEGLRIDIERIYNEYQIQNSKFKIQNNDIVIEGAGGILVPLNENEFVIDLIKKLGCKVILVSRNYLGSINHSLLTAQICRQHNIDVLGWIFNDQYLNYEEEIVRWSGYPKLLSVPFSKTINKAFIKRQAALLKENLSTLL